MLLPIINKSRYLHAFHSAPHMRPPMCLQYAIWTMAANGHEKYGTYHDVFYWRARRYLEADELKVRVLPRTQLPYFLFRSYNLQIRASEKTA